MTTVTQAPATLDDLMRVEGKTELIGGRIVHSMAGTRIHARIAGRIYISLDAYAARAGIGEAFPDNTGFALKPKLPNGRESFSPDAAYHAGPFPADEWTFIVGGPTFAVEVRSNDDYLPSGQTAMAEKRDDYFAAGTLAVWDVDPDAETVTLYLATDPATGVAFRCGDAAHAGPAVPNWTMDVADVFA